MFKGLIFENGFICMLAALRERAAQYGQLRETKHQQLAVLDHT